MKLKLIRKQTDADSTQQLQSAGDSSLSAYRNTNLAGALLILLALGLAWGWLAQTVFKQTDSKKMQDLARLVAASLSDGSRFYGDLLAELARDPAVANALEGNDRDALRVQRERLTRLIPEALQVRLLPFEYDVKDKSLTPHMSFASLELLRKAEISRQVPPLEVHQFTNEHKHLALAAAVRQEGADRPLGVIHLALPLAAVQPGFSQTDEKAGRIELRQLEGETRFTVFANQTTQSVETRPDGVYRVKGSIWEVAYWKSPHAGAQFTGNPLTWGILVGAMVLVGLLLFVQHRRLSGAVKSDQTAVVNLVDEILSGKTIRRHPVLIRENAEVIEMLAQKGRESRKGQSPLAKKEEAARDTAEAVSGRTGSGEMPPGSSAPGVSEMPAAIFRDYDIRGVVDKDLTPDVVRDIGRAIGSQASDQGQQALLVARDGRASSEALADALISGLRSSGRDVNDLGLAPTPVLYFATHFLGSDSGVMVTGSHNPPEYNGLKIVLSGETLGGDKILKLKQRVENGNLLTGMGSLQEQDLVPDYVDRVVDDVRLARPLKIVTDCGNGAASVVVPSLMRALGCDVVDLFCEVDGGFPNHHPDPSRPENLQPLIQEVLAQQADIGLAFDGDGDRLGVVDSNGKIIWPDRLLMLLAADVLSRQPGADIVFDVKCSRHLAREILAHGGRPLMWKTGHSNLKAKAKETGALLAGELSGHIVFNERWYGFDDGIYAAARVLEILALDPRTSAEIFADLPDSVSTPELFIDVPEGRHIELMGKLMDQQSLFSDAKLITIDGLRAEFEEGWGLVRASNTTPALVFRFEAESKEGLEKIKEIFRTRVSQVEPGLELPF